ncbi:hypothetical protein [Thermomonas carbonis]|uniref:Lipoprotein n=1 Tax=Thermomonas carbonis TaxID=1463158 RepID=A0A7G9SPJ6_9GAMM|nr:hypothetical protein [Thermomonas carbonis]QNN69771.1 hypothetical protein H9L16_14125 [Thermomonas carbonis]GHB95395.1 hypothetical protein GCM10010080_03590 [Thermomonas carbonis]
MSASLQRNTCVPLALLLLVGCVQRGDQPPPANFPAIDTARMPGMPACPDLTGTFSSVVDAGSEPALARFGALVDKESSAIEFAGQGAALRLAMWWTSKEIESKVATLAWRDDAEYVVWWRGARDVLSYPVEPGTPAVALASSVPGPTPVRAFELSLECSDGWMAMSDAHQLARDVGGGLLLREDHEVRRVELPLWCGDGCRGITLYSRTEARWARFPPTQLPVFRPIDFATLPVPKLATEQERNAATAAHGSSSG